MVISENFCIFIVLNYKVLQTIIAMLSKDKVTELFYLADDFYKFFDWMMALARKGRMKFNPFASSKRQNIF